jgi:hypothetical protein
MLPKALTNVVGIYSQKGMTVKSKVNADVTLALTQSDAMD